jgi:hypothetical protein
MDTALADLNRRLPFTEGLTGTPLAESIRKHWYDVDPLDRISLFAELAVAVAERRC